MTEHLTPAEIQQELAAAAEQVARTRSDTPSVKRLLAAANDASVMQREAASAILELNEKLLAIIAEQAGVLDLVQWSATSPMGNECCPRCLQSREAGHSPDCDLFALSDVERVDERLGDAAGGMEEL